MELLLAKVITLGDSQNKLEELITIFLAFLSSLESATLVEAPETPAGCGFTHIIYMYNIPPSPIVSIMESLLLLLLDDPPDPVLELLLLLELLELELELELLPLLLLLLRAVTVFRCSAWDVGRNPSKPSWVGRSAGAVRGILQITRMSITDPL